MAYDGARAARQHGRHPHPVTAHLGSSNRIDATEDRMEPSSLQPVVDRVRIEAELEQLPACYDPVLAPKKRSLKVCMTHRS
jgi:hypothetical protein